jgi:hypothetical protein
MYTDIPGIMHTRPNVEIDKEPKKEHSNKIHSCLASQQLASSWITTIIAICIQLEPVTGYEENDP